MNPSTAISPSGSPASVAKTFDYPAALVAAPFVSAPSCAAHFQIFSDRALHLALPPGRQPRLEAGIACEYTPSFFYSVRNAGGSGRCLHA